DAIGWRAFFWITIASGAPGLILLARFVPLGTREPTFTVEPPTGGEPLGASALVLRGVVGGTIALVASGLLVAARGARQATRSDRGGGFALGPALVNVVHPRVVAAWVALGGLPLVALVCGLFPAAVAPARHGG